MRTADTVVFILNGTFAFLAVAVNAWAARNDDRRRRPLRVAIGLLAAVYAVGYVWVLTTGDIADWSELFRGISVISWPLVWCAPPITGVIIHQRDKRKLQATIESSAG
jgi:hypothetical protein